jgi:hypothetical protein
MKQPAFARFPAVHGGERWRTAEKPGTEGPALAVGSAMHARRLGDDDDSAIVEYYARRIYRFERVMHRGVSRR